MSRQFYELKVGETLTVGDSRITLEAKSGQRARLRVDSDAPTAKGIDRPRQAAPVQPFLPRPKATG